MLKCLRRAEDVASVSWRTRVVVSASVGSSADMCIWVSGFANECSESGMHSKYMKAQGDEARSG